MVSSILRKLDEHTSLTRSHISIKPFVQHGCECRGQIGWRSSLRTPAKAPHLWRLVLHAWILPYEKLPLKRSFMLDTEVCDARYSQEIQLAGASGPRIQEPNMHDGMKTKSRPRHARTFIPSSCLGLESEVAALRLALRVRDS